MYAFFMMIKATFWVSIPKIPKSDKWSIFFRVNSSIQTNVRRDTNLGASINHLSNYERGSPKVHINI